MRITIFFRSSFVGTDLKPRIHFELETLTATGEPLEALFSGVAGRFCHLCRDVLTELRAEGRAITLTSVSFQKDAACPPGYDRSLFCTADPGKKIRKYDPAAMWMIEQSDALFCNLYWDLAPAWETFPAYAEKLGKRVVNFAQPQTAAAIRAAIDLLPPRERRTLELRERGLTYQQIGDILEVTGNRARQIEIRARHRLEVQEWRRHREQD